MTKVKITIGGSFDLAAASLDRKELTLLNGVAEPSVSDGKHVLFWQVRGQPGSAFTVKVEPGLKDAIKLTIPDEGEDASQVVFVIPEPKKKDA